MTIVGVCYYSSTTKNIIPNRVNGIRLSFWTTSCEVQGNSSEPYEAVQRRIVAFDPLMSVSPDSICQDSCTYDVYSRHLHQWLKTLVDIFLDRLFKQPTTPRKDPIRRSNLLSDEIRHGLSKLQRLLNLRQRSKQWSLALPVEPRRSSVPL